jgi:hypothetical protein
VRSDPTYRTRLLTSPSLAAWDKAWRQGLTPWDSKQAQPALRELLEKRWDQVGVPWSSLIGGDALVAGCGKVRGSSLKDTCLPSRLLILEGHHTGLRRDVVRFNGSLNARTRPFLHCG